VVRGRHAVTRRLTSHTQARAAREETRRKIETLSTYKLLIDGKLVDGASSLEVINPATGKVLETASKADEAQLNEAVAVAKKAFPRWSASSFEERVWVNKFLEVPFDVPFRGAKQSGLGGENGEEAMASYTQAKIINVAL